VRKIIATLETANEGSRELDALIWAASGQESYTQKCCFKGKKYGGVLHTTAAEKRAKIHYLATLLAPPFSTSIDVAMTLVPQQIECGTINFSRNKSGQQYCHATLEQSADSLGRDMRDDEPTEIEALNAATPALALCIAALKARSA